MICELMEAVMTIDPFWPVSLHNLSHYCQYLHKSDRVKTILRSRSGGIKDAKHVDVIHLLEVFLGKLEGWLYH